MTISVLNFLILYIHILSTLLDTLYIQLLIIRFIIIQKKLIFSQH